MGTNQGGDWVVNRQPYTLEPLPSKVENFIKRRDRATQERISRAFEHIIHSPFRHDNPTTIKPFYGSKNNRYRYRIGDIRLIYRVDRGNRLIRIVQIDNRGDIY